MENITTIFIAVMLKIHFVPGDGQTPRFLSFMSVSSITPIVSAHHDIHNWPLNDYLARVLLWPADVECLSMIPSANPIALNKYINIRINLCRPILRNILLKEDQFMQLYVSSKINYIFICMYSVFRRKQHNYVSKVTSVGLFT